MYNQVAEIKTSNNIEEINNYLAQGWRLLHLYSVKETFQVVLARLEQTER